MAISPTLELNNILSWINKGVNMFNSISFLFIITAIFSMFFFLQSHIKERLGDYALLVCLGASWLKIAKVVLWQNIFIGLISIILTYIGLFILWLSLDQINIFGDIIEKNYFWQLYQDAYWVLGVLILAFSVGRANLHFQNFPSERSGVLCFACVLRRKKAPPLRDV